VSHLVDARLAQCRIGPSYVGMIANLGLDISLTPNKDTRHPILGQVGFHLARIEAFDQHQHYQGHI
jgi:hypothetical protein